MRKSYIDIGLDDLQIPASDLAESAALAWRRGKHPIVLLSGNMGSGKTTLVSRFVQELYKELSVSKNGSKLWVNSPTYTLMNEYPIPEVQSEAGEKLSIFHFDLYRLSGEAETEDLGFEEYWGRRGICIVEWWDRAPKAFSSMQCSASVSIYENGTEESRNLNVEWLGSDWTSCDSELASILNRAKKEIG
ncbi:tRNA (adenosine(37)-N6)-threonylcarbamoyltransferase complex ATPase subunit type 1 TsaE [Leptospira fletcheri]|uniref:tRNA threonylcarbamoyladenosine biosynthesis protein TsaE n=1 Tax=Leptospira fletcheri TaxID=2484981 RepID=A0A4R9GGN4_9LEPT|nr:tRNA (adenosine(37)-N6)-threonylcarbamoyltransferase complex ATPase subunit type 1 TsaE [Leptospira fletcheri]TGK11719.1 tRNA (adenosine(37)-N6)-threonylcarbamoyltransferase complex ATPase subunit type 1 TsaE [Leptospira fletcheri]